MKLRIFRFRDFEINLKLFHIRFYCGIILAAALFAGLRMYDAAIYANLILPAAIAGLGMLDIRCNKTCSMILNGLWAGGSAVLLFYLPQYLLSLGIGGISVTKMILGIVFAVAVILFFYVLLRNMRISVTAAYVLLAGMSIVNFFVLSFRGEELSPADFMAVGTAMNVASQYDYSINVRVLYFACLAVIGCFAGFSIPNYKGKFKLRNTIALAAVELVLICAIGFGVQDIHAEHFMNTGSYVNGFFVNFLTKLKGSGVEKPEEYNDRFLDSLAEPYAGGQNESERKPDIIVVMAEAFGDLRVMGELNTDTEVMPFYDSLQEDTIRGKALVSVYGGGTCNSEFEVLTGFSMSNLPFKTFPFQQYVKEDLWSMARYLDDLGYASMATHPEKDINWKRNIAYPCLGFEETHFLNDYPREDLVRGHVSDEEMYEQMIAWYEEEKKENGGAPLFYFGVTMQNHSPYDTEGFTPTVHLEGYSKEYPEVEQYLTLTRQSDDAIRNLVEYFENVEDEVVVVFFGDHMPKLDAFYEEQNGGPLDCLEDELNKRTIPFFIWANYDIEEKEVECTSLNYLSNFIYEAAGIQLPAYQQFLGTVMEKIPAISALGYYSAEKGGFAELEEMTAEEKEMMMKYACLQYNGMFDSENYQEVFFPMNTEN